MKIFRYQLNIDTINIISLPTAYRVLSCAPARNAYAIDLWVQVSPSDHNKDVQFEIYGTGHPMLEDALMPFIGTCVMSDGLVWHVFEK